MDIALPLAAREPLLNLISDAHGADINRSVATVRWLVDAHGIATAPLPRRTRWWVNAAHLYVTAKEAGRVPTLADGAPSKLVSMAKNARRARNLDSLQLAWLDQLPGWQWEPHEEHWFERADALENYVIQHGRMPRRSAETREESSLALWATRALAPYQQRRLSNARERRARGLDSLIERVTKRTDDGAHEVQTDSAGLAPG